MAAKKVKLTPEEKRQRRLERRRLKRERKAARLLQIQRDRLDRELRYSALTTRENERHWRQMLVNIALPRMRAELELAWHNFERTIDCKDYTISLLMDDLQYAEDHHMLSFKSHADHIDKIIMFFHDRLDDLKNDYENELAQLLNRNEAELMKIAENSQNTEEFLKTMLFALECTKKEQDRMLRAMYYAKMEEEKTKEGEHLVRLKGCLEAKFKGIHDETTKFFKDFRERTDQRIAEYNKKMETHTYLQGVLAHQITQAITFNDRIRNLKDTLREKEKTTENILDDLQKERTYLYSTFWALRKSLTEEQNVDYDKMVLASELSNDVQDFLTNVIKKGEQVLAIGAICRKFETRQEKVEPFPLMDETKKCFKGDRMALFWQKVGQANASRMAILEEIHQLIIENDNLRDKAWKKINENKGVSMQSLAFKTYGTIAKTDGNMQMKKYEQLRK